MKSIVIGAHLERGDVEPLARAIAAGEVFLSAHDVEDERPLGDRALLVEVARIRSELLDRATFVAIRYGLAAKSDDEARAKTTPLTARWHALLERHRGRVEVTIKAAAANPLPRPDRRVFSSGASYLEALHKATRAAAADPSFREAAEGIFAPVAVGRRWLSRDERSVELVMLVERERLDEVRAAGEELRRATPHVPFLLSGPWPLEIFADDDHE